MMGAGFSGAFDGNRDTIEDEPGLEPKPTLSLCCDWSDQTTSKVEVPESREGFNDPIRDDDDGFISDRFKLLSRLGQGGMGDVYRAEDLTLDEIVALKVIRGDDAALIRLKREVKLQRRIASPHVCRVFDLAELGGGFYGIAMELVEGQTLGDLIRAKTAVDFKRIARWGADMARGLCAAHEAGVIHRDLKPDNVIVDETDVAVIVDFGVALGDEGSFRVTRNGVIIGTPRYMSPEQLAGRRVGARSDLFALGLILAELITGVVVLGGVEYQSVAKRRLQRPEPYSILDDVPGVPASLALVIDRLLSLSVSERPSSAALVARQLEAYLRSENETGPTHLPVGAPPRTFGRARRLRPTVKMKKPPPPPPPPPTLSPQAMSVVDEPAPVRSMSMIDLGRDARMRAFAVLLFVVGFLAFGLSVALLLSTYQTKMAADAGSSAGVGKGAEKHRAFQP